MIGENIPSGNSENNIETQSAESNTTTYQNLGKQVEFNPDRAKRLQNGEDLNEEPQNKETIDALLNNEGKNSINNQDILELLDEKEQVVERKENIQEQKEKSRAEQRLESIQERLNKIEKELLEANSNKDKIEEEIEACEVAIDSNIEQHNQLLDKANQLKLEIKKTKRNVMVGFTNGLKIAKNLVLGRHEDARKILSEISNSVNSNEKAMYEHKKTETALEANEAEKATLDDTYANAIDEKNSYINKISQLEKQKIEAAKQLKILKEEVANQAWIEAWKDAQEGIKAEMGNNNITAFKRELSNQKEKLEENLKEDLNELDSYRNPSRIQRLMRTEEELQRDAERANEVEGRLIEEYENATAAINAKREKTDRYFPTWQERVKNIRENNLVKGALSALKRKVMMKIYGIA